MRSLVLLIALATTAHAQSSKTMERALRFFERLDFANASIEFQKVLDDTDGDTVETKQRAELGLAKTLHELGFHAAALYRLDQITQSGPAHRYFFASARLVLDIMRVTAAAPTPRGVLFAYAGTGALDDPMNAEVRDTFALQLGREIAARGRPNTEAIEMLAKSRHPRAELELARVYLAAGDFGRGVARAKVAARTPELAVEAAQLVAHWSHAHKNDASAALAELADTSAYARYQASRAKLDRARAALSSVPIEAFDAVMLPSACRGKFPDDVRPLARLVIDEAKPVIDKLLAFDDNIELEKELRKLHAQHSPGGDVVLAVLDDMAYREQAAWLLEIQTELELFARSSKGWQSTQVGANVLQDLTVFDSLESANTGAMARARLKTVKDSLEALAVPLAAAPAIAAGPDGTLVVTAELCGRGGTAPSLSARPTSGCAGCASSGPGGWPLALVVAMLVARARRDRSRDTRARRG